MGQPGSGIAELAKQVDQLPAVAHEVSHSPALFPEEVIEAGPAAPTVGDRGKARLGGTGLGQPGGVLRSGQAHPEVRHPARPLLDPAGGPGPEGGVAPRLAPVLSQAIAAVDRGVVAASGAV